MKLHGDFCLAKVIERHNKYLASIQLEESKEKTFAHVPDPGRLKDVLVPTAKIVVRREDATQRKTAYTIVGIKFNQIWINIQSSFTNKLFEFEYMKIPALSNFDIIKREYRYGSSRIDFLMQDKITLKQILLEVKSSTLAVNNQALFPDAPTLRGVKHVRELIKSTTQGFKAIIVFVIKRSDVSSLTLNKNIDPLFAKTLKEAVEAGVQVLAIRTSYDPLIKQEIKIENEVPVLI